MVVNMTRAENKSDHETHCANETYTRRDVFQKYLLYSGYSNIEINEKVLSLSAENLVIGDEELKSIGILAAIASDYNLQYKIITSHLVFDTEIHLDLSQDITFISKNDIRFTEKARLIQKGNGNIYLKSGIDNDHGKVIFENKNEKQMKIESESKIYIHYHPEANKSSEYNHKYHNAYKYSQHIESNSLITSYMLVNDINDLQNIRLFSSGNYALSQNIDGSETINWNEGKGFKPVKMLSKYLSEPAPFSGNFDGNNFSISGLFIKRPSENYVGLFGVTTGFQEFYREIKDLTLTDITVSGHKYVGLISGKSDFAKFNNIFISNAIIEAYDLGGGVFGTGSNINLDAITCNSVSINMEELENKPPATKGLLAGAIRNSEIGTNMCCSDYGTIELDANCFGYSLDISYILTEGH